MLSMLFLYPIYAYHCQFLAFQCDFPPEDHQSLSFQTHSLGGFSSLIGRKLPPTNLEVRMRSYHTESNINVECRLYFTRSEGIAVVALHY